MKLTKRFVILASVVAVLVSSLGVADAMWVKLSDAELIDGSDIIVSAELIGQTQFRVAPDQPKLTVGVLRVDEVLKGDAGISVALLVLPSPNAPRSSTDLVYRKGQKGLWFLHVRDQKDSGLHRADHPQRFVPLEQSAQIDAFKRLLRKQ